MVFMTVAPQFHSIRFPRLIHNALCIVLKHMFGKGTEGWLPHRISFVRKKHRKAPTRIRIAVRLGPTDSYAENGRPPLRVRNWQPGDVRPSDAPCR